MPLINLKKLFVKATCKFCRVTLVPTELNNQFLEPKDRIEVIDNMDWEFFNVESQPIVNKVMNKSNESYPTLVFDGLKIKGFLSKSQVKACLDALTEDKRIVDREKRWR